MQFLAAAAVLLAVFGTGSTVVRVARIRLPDGLRGVATTFAVGFVALSTLVFALGRLGAFSRWVLAPLALAGAVLGLVAVLPRVSRPRRPRGIDEWLLTATGALVALDVFLAGAPPTSGDALQYHLGATRLWLQAGRMYDIWWDQVTFQPLAVEMHYALAQALWNGAAGSVVGAGFAAFSVVCVYGLARELAGPRAAAIAALLWAGQGMFVWEATGAFTEIATAAFVALALWHVVVLSRRGAVADAAWAGLAMGAASATKYFGGFVAVGVLVAVVLVSPPARRWVAAGVFLAVTAVCLPWYLKNAIVAGNPLYPTFTHLLGGKYAGASFDDYARVKREQRGMPGLWRVAILPIEFIVHRDKFDRGYSISPAFFTLAPLAVVLWWRRRWVLAAGASLVLYTLVWDKEMFGIPRYLVPVLPLAAVLAAVAAERWRRLTIALLALTAVPFLAIVALFTVRLAPGAAGIESTPHFVQRLTGTYDAFHWMDTRLPPDGRILLGVRGAYWLHRPYATFDLPIFGGVDPPAVIAARMRRYDVRYLAFYEGGLPQPLRALRPQLHRVAVLDVPLVTSRALGSTTSQRLVVYRWSGSRSSTTRQRKASSGASGASSRSSASAGRSSASGSVGLRRQPPDRA